MPWMIDAMEEKDKKLFLGMLPPAAISAYNLSFKGTYNPMVSALEIG